jgi:hypothetical protein
MATVSATTSGAAAGVPVGTTAAIRADRRGRDRSPLPERLRPIDPASFGYAEARHLLWRAGFGGTPAQVRTLADWGPERSGAHLVRFEGAPETGVDAGRFRDDIMAPLTDEQRRLYREALRTQNEEVVARFRRRRQAQQRDDRRQMGEMQTWWLERMIESPRPLEEKMTLFWHSHFATSYRTIENSWHLFKQNQLFREHATSNFGELLFRIIRDPAMLAYLDNNESRVGAPNENLARELMELFSLGEGGYSERDIQEGARALTGYGFRGNEFVFREQLHDRGAKRILGVTGNLDGDDFVRAILETRRCSEFIAMKLYEFFVAPLPATSAPDYRAMTSAIKQMAREIRRHRYDLAPALEMLFTSEHFYHERFIAERIKSPAELVVGAVRSLRTPVRSLRVLVDAMDLMGQRLFLPPNVAGWAEGRSWINTSTLFVRQNVLNFLLTGKTPSGFDPLADIERYDPMPLLDDLAAVDPGAERDAGRVVEYLVRFMLGRAPTFAQRDTLEAFVRETGGRVNEPVLTGLLVLISSMPEYQLC